MCAHFDNIPEFHRRPGSCALQKATDVVVNSDLSAMSGDGLGPKGAGQVIGATTIEAPEVSWVEIEIE